MHRCLKVQRFVIFFSFAARHITERYTATAVRSNPVVACRPVSGKIGPGTLMPALPTSRIPAAVICFGVLLLAACKPPREAPMSVEEFMEDRVALDGVLLKCNDPAIRDKAGINCEAARIAVERLAQGKEAAGEAPRQQPCEPH